MRDRALPAGFVVGGNGIPDGNVEAVGIVFPVCHAGDLAVALLVHAVKRPERPSAGVASRVKFMVSSEILVAEITHIADDFKPLLLLPRSRRGDDHRGR